jgi:pimeloyl-ACP methyl ester carboxylesterase
VSIVDTPDFNTVFSHGKARVNGTTLHFVMGGKGPALLLIHGWMGSWYSWRKLMPLLAERFTVIAPDARGYGDSAKPYAGYDGLTVMEDMRQLLKTLGVQKAVVIGHDMGAPVALLFAAHHPDEVTGLGYLDEPLLGYNLDRFTAFDTGNPFVYWWFSFNATEHVPAMLWEGKEAQMVDFMISSMVADVRSVTNEDKAEYVRGLRSPGGLHGSFGWYRESLKTSVQIVSATKGKVLAAPVLALNGQYGHPGVSEQFAGIAKNVMGGVIANCGHLIAEEQPAALAAEIHAFADKFTLAPVSGLT